VQKLLWVIPPLLIFLGCDMNAGCDGTFVGCCDGSTKRHADSNLLLHFYTKCNFDDGCDLNLYFSGSFRDTIRGSCGLDFNLMLQSDDSLVSVRSDRTYMFSVKEKEDASWWFKNGEYFNFPLIHEDHIKFSLIDADKVSKDYDIDVSEIVHSYEYDGDSVRVKVLDNCRVTLFWRKKGYVEKNFEYYRGNIQGEYFSFPISDDYLSYFDCNCWLHKQSSFGTDDVELAFRIYWK